MNKITSISIRIGLIVAGMLVLLPDAIAQISFSGSHFATLQTRYGDTVSNDPVFLLDNFELNRPVLTDSFRVKAPAEYGNSTFIWNRFDETLLDYSAELQQTTGSTSSTLALQPSVSGYQVSIVSTEKELDTLRYRAWVFYPSKLTIQVEKKNDGTVVQHNCKWVKLLAEITSLDTFYYYHPVEKYQLQLGLGSVFMYGWSKDNQQVGRSNYSSVFDYGVPFENTDYTFKASYTFKQLDTVQVDTIVAPLVPIDTLKDVQGKDSLFICTSITPYTVDRSDKVKYESVMPNAVFTTEIADYKNEFSAGENKGPAPLLVKFINESVNATSYEWVLADTAFIALNEQPKVLTAVKDTEVLYTYHIPRTYNAMLVAINNVLGCRDTSEVVPITVEVSELLAMPNVFTPNGDGQNDFFRPNGNGDADEMKSIRDLHLVIYNRAGRKVYEYTHDSFKNINQWPGWDGKDDKKRDAPTGIYYFVVEASGWDSVAYKGKKYSGALYLFR